MKKRHCLFGICAAIAFVVLSVGVARQPIFSFVYQIECRFESWPENDAALRQWLVQQPGVVPHTVQIERDESSRNVIVTFLQSRNAFGTPPFPPFDDASRELGYGDNRERWRDVSRR